MIRRPNRIPSGNDQVDKAIDQAARSARDASDSPILDGLPIYGIRLASGALVKVNHGLGRKFKAVFPSLIERVAGAGNGTVEILRQGNAAKEIYLKATGYGGTVVVDVWVI